MLDRVVLRRQRRRLGHTGTRAAAIGVIAGFALRIWATATAEFGLAFLAILAVVVFAVLLLLWPAVTLSGYAVRRRTRAAPTPVRQAGGVAGLLFLVLGGILLTAGLTIHVTAAVPGTAFVLFGGWVVWNAFRLPGADPSLDRAARWNHWGPPLAAAAVLLLLVVHGTIVDERRGFSRELGYRAAMRSDLRNLVRAQELVRDETGRYATDVGGRMVPSPGTVGPDIRVTSDGWRATMRHQGTDVRCAVFVGSTPHPPAAAPAEPACTDLATRRLRDGPLDIALFLLGIGLGGAALWTAGRPAADVS